MKINLIFIIVILIFSSCKKTIINETNIFTESSQLWVKVGSNVPNFTIKFICQNFNNNKKYYFVDYVDKVFNPNQKSFTDSTNNETWVLVYKSFDRTDEIVLQLQGGTNVYKAKGFEFGEKRFIDVSINTGGSVNIEDRDITTINKIIYIEHLKNKTNNMLVPFAEKK